MSKNLKGFINGFIDGFFVDDKENAKAKELLSELGSLADSFKTVIASKRADQRLENIIADVMSDQIQDSRRKIEEQSSEQKSLSDNQMVKIDSEKANRFFNEMLSIDDDGMRMLEIADNLINLEDQSLTTAIADKIVKEEIKLQDLKEVHGNKFNSKFAGLEDVTGPIVSRVIGKKPKI